MKSRKTLRAVTGTVLCAAGFWLAFPKPYLEKTYLIPNGGCRLETLVLEKREGAPQGTVVLLPGLAANKRIMFYLARGFAEQDLRVFVPDLPGHGHSPGPFSPEHAEECAAALLAGMFARGMANPDRTIVAGHSMGGAIALRVGARIPVAGVAAISPAPMRSAHGVRPEMLLFQDPGRLPQRFVVINGGLEPESMRGNAADLVSLQNDETRRYIEIPRATHASLLFDPAVVRAFQHWTSQTLQLTGTPAMPSLRQLYGALAGFVGLLVLANPFLREIMRRKQVAERAEEKNPVGLRRTLIEFAAGAILTVVLLEFWNPLRVVRVYQGDYLAAFLLILGIALILLHWKSQREQFPPIRTGLLGAIFGGLILFLLFSAWLELSLYEAWLTPAKWARFPALFVALFPYHFAEEICLGPAANQSGWRRLLAGLSLRVVVWSALILGVFYLHSGEILMVLLVPYFVLVHVLQRRGMDIVHQGTGSAVAAAAFGAILLTGFCLVIFPVT